MCPLLWGEFHERLIDAAANLVTRSREASVRREVHARVLRPRGAADQAIDLDGQRDGVVAEIVRVRAGAQAELRSVPCAVSRDRALRRNQRDRIRTVRRRPEKAPDIVSRAEGVDPLDGPDLRGRWLG